MSLKAFTLFWFRRRGNCFLFRATLMISEFVIGKSLFIVVTLEEIGTAMQSWTVDQGK